MPFPADYRGGEVLNDKIREMFYGTPLLFIFSKKIMLND